MRELIERSMQPEAVLQGAEDPLYELIGMGASGETETATRHDELLYGGDRSGGEP
jgi:hypothetical protein